MDLRSIPVRGFQDLLVVYEVSDATETVSIFRILHGKRDLEQLV
jgi:plasmid stabilization system protein ParE